MAECYRLFLQEQIKDIIIIRHGDRETRCMCVCVCVREREREREGERVNFIDNQPVTESR